MQRWIRPHRTIALCVCLLVFVSAEKAGEAPHVTAPPAELKLDPFYKKYVDAAGIPVVSSDKVPDRALLGAREIVIHMLSQRDDVRGAIVKNQVRVAIMSKDEVTTDIPEHADLNKVFPGTDWNTRCRGVGATVERPASSGAEENLLVYAKDPYKGENIFIHEFAHTIFNTGIKFVDKDFADELRKAYDSAMQRGLWKQTYAATNADEYWAEGVQDWFDANLHADPPNGIHNAVHTREQLKKYDPELARLIRKIFPDDGWRYRAGAKSVKP